jgi:MFS transporter, NRE family, putaive nickel resistance protein
MNRSLFHNRAFMTLYAAQTVNLLGDALSWVGLALLAYDLAGLSGGSALLATALTVRVMAFVVVSPWAGLVADRMDRKMILLTTHVCRMILISGLPFIQHPNQLLAIVLGLNIFNGIFSPTYKATLPLVTGKADYADAIALSGTTYQLLGVLGPGIAGGVAAWVGTRQIFFLDAITFLIAAVLVLMIPDRLTPANPSLNINRTSQQPLWQELSVGSLCLWHDRSLRYGLLLQLVTALSGAQILVNTVNYVQGDLHLGKVEYGWVMGAFGVGATIASAFVSKVSDRDNRLGVLSLGCGVLTSVMLVAQGADLWGLMGLWAMAGVGQSLMDISMQLLIADRISVELQGRVYGAHFAWSHLWWVLAYPIAGGLAQSRQQPYFWISGMIAFGLMITIAIVAKLFPASPQGFWHEHFHEHFPANSHEHQHSSDHDLEHYHYHFHGTEHPIDSKS